MLHTVFLVAGQNYCFSLLLCLQTKEPLFQAVKVKSLVLKTQESILTDEYGVHMCMWPLSVIFSYYQYLHTRVIQGLKYVITEQPRDSPQSALKTPSTQIGCLHISFSILAMPNISNFKLKRYIIIASNNMFKVFVIVQSEQNSVAVSSFGQDTQKCFKF